MLFLVTFLRERIREKEKRVKKKFDVEVETMRTEYPNSQKKKLLKSLALFFLFLTFLLGSQRLQEEKRRESLNPRTIAGKWFGH